MRTALLLLALSRICSAGLIVVTPFPDLQGNPGDLVGWGYFLFDDAGHFDVPTFSEFNPVPDNGLYIDFVSLASNFVVAPAFGAGGQFFDPVLRTGLGEFFIDPATPAGTVINGTITLHYDQYGQDPNFNPDSFLSGDGFVSKDVSISVVSPAPEPGAAGMVLAGLALLLFASLGKRRKIGC